MVHGYNELYKSWGGIFMLKILTIGNSFADNATRYLGDGLVPGTLH